MMNGQQNNGMTKVGMTGKAHNSLAKGFASFSAKKQADKQVDVDKKEITETAIKFLKEQGYEVTK